MAFEIRKTSDVGTSHPVVARLAVQTSELIDWLKVDKPQREAILELYIHALKPRLLRCDEIFNGLVQKIADGGKTLNEQRDPRVRTIPHVIGLQGMVEQFLYEAKNYLRDLLILFQIVFDCKLADASAFADLKGKGESDLVTWANALLGADDPLSKLLKTEQEWTGELIRKRNAIEHPGGFSGTLTVENIRVNPEHPDSYIAPTWQRTGGPVTEIVKDMDCALYNMLSLAEELLVHSILHKPTFKEIAVYEIREEDRRPECPIRFRVGLSTELQEKLGKRPKKRAEPVPGTKG